MYSASALADRVRERLGSETTLALVADVVEDLEKRDLAIALAANQLAVIRCVRRATPHDYTALTNMVSAGDFVWAGLVCSDQLETDRAGAVGAFHLSEMSRLIERLHELKRAAAS